MRRLLTTSLVAFISVALPGSASAQSISASSPSLAGTRELGVFLSGRLLSTEYSADEGKTGFGGALTFATHLKSMLAFQAGIAGNYSRQGYSFYRPPLMTFTPTVSMLIQRSTVTDFQPYALIGAGYEFIHYTHPRCDCEQSRSLGVGNVGLGVRRMTSGRRAIRFEVSSQIGKGGPAFTALAGMSWFLGTRNQFNTPRMQPPQRRRNEPPLLPIPKQSATVQPGSAPVALPPAAPPPTPSNTVTRTRPASPLPAGIGTVLLTFNGTQVDFSRPTWRDDAELMLDGLVVDLTSDAGKDVKVSIEAHTDNVGSNAANIMLGLDRARAVRDYLVSQGVAPARIRISSAGEDTPIAPNTTAIGRQQNRRIIIKRDN